MNKSLNDALAGFARNLQAAENPEIIKAKTVTARVMNKAVREGATRLTTQRINGLQYSVAKCPKRGMIQTPRI